MFDTEERRLLYY